MAFTLNLAGATVAGDVVLGTLGAAICSQSGVVAATIAVVIGEVAGTRRTHLRSCGAAISLTALGSLGDEGTLLVDVSLGGSVTVSTAFVRTVQIGACTSGTALLNVTRLRTISIADTANCTMTLNGTVGLGCRLAGSRCSAT